MSEQDIYFLVYIDGARTMGLTISEHETLFLAKKYKRKMIRKGIYMKADLHIHCRPVRFGEGCYGF